LFRSAVSNVLSECQDSIRVAAVHRSGFR
jgi:hypothetical protein